MSRRVAIVQSNYIPWKGYFDLMAAVDEFVLFDEVQYTRRDWRNRNRIKTPHGPRWLTIPVAVKGRYTVAIRDVEVSDRGWSTDHWQQLRTNYASARSFDELAPSFEELYRSCTHERLSDVNRHFLVAIMPLLGIETPLRWSWEYPVSEAGDASHRLAEICARAGASVYVSGPAAKAYLRAAPFSERGIAIEWFEYSGHPEYEQLHPPFDHHVSIVDLLFNTGRDARRYLLAGQP